MILGLCAALWQWRPISCSQLTIISRSSLKSSLLRQRTGDLDTLHISVHIKVNLNSYLIPFSIHNVAYRGTSIFLDFWGLRELEVWLWKQMKWEYTMKHNCKGWSFFALRVSSIILIILCNIVLCRHHYSLCLLYKVYRFLFKIWIKIFFSVQNKSVHASIT